MFALLFGMAALFFGLVVAGAADAAFVVLKVLLVAGFIVCLMKLGAKIDEVVQKHG